MKRKVSVLVSSSLGLAASIAAGILLSTNPVLAAVLLGVGITGVVTGSAILIGGEIKDSRRIKKNQAKRSHNVAESFEAQPIRRQVTKRQPSNSVNATMERE